MAERDLKKYLLNKVKRLKGEARKVSWEGRKNAPDWRVICPGYYPFWVELKAKGKTPNVTQMRELERMRRLGERVYWADNSFRLDTVFADNCYV